MADVKVNITGDNKELTRSLTDSEKKLKKMASSAKKSSQEVSSGLSGAAKAGKAFGSVMGGGLGLGLAVAGLKTFDNVVGDVMKNARRQADLTKAAFSGAFSSISSFDLGGDKFTFSSRDDIIKAGRIAKQELNQVQADLEKNFSRLINSGVVSGTIEKALAAGSLIGVGEDENRLFQSLTTRRDILQEQVDSFEAQAQKQTVLNQLSKKYVTELGLQTDEQRKANEEREKAIAQTKLLNDIRPDRPDSIAPGGSFQTFSNFGPLPPGLPEKKDFIDPSITLELISLQKAVDAGVIPSLQGMRTEAGLLQEQLLFMLESGIDPSNVGFQAMLANMQGLQGQAENFGGEIKGNTAEFQILNSVASEALSGIGFHMEDINDKAAKLRNTLRRVGNVFLDIAIKTGLNLGIGALTGNPLSVGDALRGAVGLPGKAGAASFSAPSLSTASIGGTNPIPNIGFSTSQQIATNPRQAGQELVATVNGAELLVMLRETNVNRENRGGRINI